jgi:hypothetical protein
MFLAGRPGNNAITGALKDSKFTGLTRLNLLPTLIAWLIYSQLCRTASPPHPPKSISGYTSCHRASLVQKGFFINLTYCNFAPQTQADLFIVQPGQKLN